MEGISHPSGQPIEIPDGVTQVLTEQESLTKPRGTMVSVGPCQQGGCDVLYKRSESVTNTLGDFQRRYGLEICRSL